MSLPGLPGRPRRSGPLLDNLPRLQADALVRAGRMPAGIKAIAIPTYLGGERWVMCCPGCSGRFQVLYEHGGRIACRNCLDAGYGSRHLDRSDPFRVANRLRRRLGAHPSLLEPLPPRPETSGLRGSMIGSWPSSQLPRSGRWRGCGRSAGCWRSGMSDGGDLVPSDLYEQIFAARIAGLSEERTAKRFGVKLTEVRRAVSLLAPRIDNETRMSELAVELGRLDRLGEVFYTVAIEEKDPQAAAIALKVSERKSSMLGLDYAPLRTDMATLTVIQPPPRPNSTQLIRAVIDRVVAERPQPQRAAPAGEVIDLEPEPVP